MELANILRQSYSGKSKSFPGGQNYFQRGEMPPKNTMNPLVN